MSNLANDKTVGFSYDPFGMITLGRNWELGSEYRYGFNGEENDNEAYGNANAVDFGARIYDCRLGRWLSLDRFTRFYPYISPYAFSLNNPIKYIDDDGFGVEGGFSVINQSSKTVIIRGAAKYQYTDKSGEDFSNEDLYGTPRTEQMDVHLYPGDQFDAYKVEEKQTINGKEVTVTKYIGIVTRAHPQEGEPKTFTVDLYDVDFISVENNVSFEIEGDDKIYKSGDNEKTGQYIQVHPGEGNVLSSGEEPDNAAVIIKNSRRVKNGIKFLTTGTNFLWLGNKPSLDIKQRKEQYEEKMKKKEAKDKQKKSN